MRSRKKRYMKSLVKRGRRKGGGEMGYARDTDTGAEITKERGALEEKERESRGEQKCRVNMALE